MVCVATFAEPSGWCVGAVLDVAWCVLPRLRSPVVGVLLCWMWHGVCCRICGAQWLVCCCAGCGMVCVAAFAEPSGWCVGAVLDVAWCVLPRLRSPVVGVLLCWMWHGVCCRVCGVQWLVCCCAGCGMVCVAAFAEPSGWCVGAVLDVAWCVLPRLRSPVVGVLLCWMWHGVCCRICGAQWLVCCCAGCGMVCVAAFAEPSDWCVGAVLDVAWCVLPRLRSPVVGVLGLCWMWHGVCCRVCGVQWLVCCCAGCGMVCVAAFAEPSGWCAAVLDVAWCALPRLRSPVVGVLLCWMWHGVRCHVCGAQWLVSWGCAGCGMVCVAAFAVPSGWCVGAVLDVAWCVLPRLRSPVVGVLGLCWMWHGVCCRVCGAQWLVCCCAGCGMVCVAAFAEPSGWCVGAVLDVAWCVLPRLRSPVVGVLLCWMWHGVCCRVCGAQWLVCCCAGCGMVCVAAFAEPSGWCAAVLDVAWCVLPRLRSPVVGVLLCWMWHGVLCRVCGAQWLVCCCAGCGMVCVATFAGPSGWCAAVLDVAWCVLPRLRSPVVGVLVCWMWHGVCCRVCGAQWLVCCCAGCGMVCVAAFAEPSGWCVGAVLDVAWCVLPRLRSPVVGVLGLCWMWHGVCCRVCGAQWLVCCCAGCGMVCVATFAEPSGWCVGAVLDVAWCALPRLRSPVVGVLGLCWMWHGVRCRVCGAQWLVCCCAGCGMVCVAAFAEPSGWCAAVLDVAWCVLPRLRSPVVGVLLCWMWHGVRCRVCGAQWLVCWGCAGCGMVCVATFAEPSGWCAAVLDVAWCVLPRLRSPVVGVLLCWMWHGVCCRVCGAQWLVCWGCAGCGMVCIAVFAEPSGWCVGAVLDVACCALPRLRSPVVGVLLCWMWHGVCCRVCGAQWLVCWGCAGCGMVFVAAFAEPSGWCVGAVLDVAWCALPRLRSPVVGVLGLCWMWHGVRCRVCGAQWLVCCCAGCGMVCVAAFAEPSGWCVGAVLDVAWCVLPRLRSPVVGVLGLCWMWHGVCCRVCGAQWLVCCCAGCGMVCVAAFAEPSGWCVGAVLDVAWCVLPRLRSPVVGVLGLCWMWHGVCCRICGAQWLVCWGCAGCGMVCVAAFAEPSGWCVGAVLDVAWCVLPRLRSPVVGVLGLCWMWHGVRCRVCGAQWLVCWGCAGCGMVCVAAFAEPSGWCAAVLDVAWCALPRLRSPVVGVLGLCWMWHGVCCRVCGAQWLVCCCPGCGMVCVAAFAGPSGWCVGAMLDVAWCVLPRLRSPVVGVLGLCWMWHGVCCRICGAQWLVCWGCAGCGMVCVAAFAEPSGWCVGAVLDVAWCVLPRLRSPVVGVLGLCWMWHGVRCRVCGAQWLVCWGCAGCGMVCVAAFAEPSGWCAAVLDVAWCALPRLRSPVVGVLGLCWMWHGVHCRVCGAQWLVCCCAGCGMVCVAAFAEPSGWCAAVLDVAWCVLPRLRSPVVGVLLCWMWHGVRCRVCGAQWLVCCCAGCGMVCVAAFAEPSGWCVGAVLDVAWCVLPRLRSPVVGVLLCWMWHGVCCRVCGAQWLVCWGCAGCGMVCVAAFAEPSGWCGAVLDVAWCVLPRLRSPVVGVLGLCWMWHGVCCRICGAQWLVCWGCAGCGMVCVAAFAEPSGWCVGAVLDVAWCVLPRLRSPVVGVLLCWMWHGVCCRVCGAQWLVCWGCAGCGMVCVAAFAEPSGWCVGAVLDVAWCVLPRLRSPVVGVLGLCWMWHGVRCRVCGAQWLVCWGCAGCGMVCVAAFAEPSGWCAAVLDVAWCALPRLRSPVVGVLGLCWMWHGVCCRVCGAQWLVCWGCAGCGMVCVAAFAEHSGWCVGAVLDVAWCVLPRLRSPVVGVLGLCWMWHGVCCRVCGAQWLVRWGCAGCGMVCVAAFAEPSGWCVGAVLDVVWCALPRLRSPVVGVLLCWMWHGVCCHVCGAQWLVCWGCAGCGMVCIAAFAEPSGWCAAVLDVAWCVLPRLQSPVVGVLLCWMWHGVCCRVCGAQWLVCCCAGCGMVCVATFAEPSGWCVGAVLDVAWCALPRLRSPVVGVLLCWMWHGVCCRVCGAQ